jgi:predicted alpha-1,2-mannosidase
LFDQNLKLLRPRLENGDWYEPFDPNDGANFSENVGFIEGNAWQYAFMIPHDILGLKKLMGGDKSFTNQLQKVFDDNQFDMANEPDIAYPYLFNYVKGEEWRSQKLVSELVEKYFTNAPDGIPGNDDTGTMSAWVVYSMLGIYPIAPGEPKYAITKPLFDKITIQLDSKYYKNSELIIEKDTNANGYIQQILLNGKIHQGYFINHEDLVNAQNLKIILK